MSLRIRRRIAQSSKKVDLLVDEGEAVSQSRTGERTVARWLRPELLPFPFGGLKFV